MLDGILPQTNLDNHVQLVLCLQLLLQDVIQPEDITEAIRLAQSYCSNFQQLYGEFIYISVTWHLNIAFACNTCNDFYR